ncbi:hypothetical protein M2132_000826 [Dysgonomonas sp. PH5-45]|uniref:hypothetical protein n=1 Tax=unclassified Dysgonomonas TaxID=2630389 RepID=UPI0024751A35|nr:MULTISPECIES: hypothetical protein [unclassified Dysgonomonas]MDH6354498.1 hypothetical protein [Dysgonomonas sp. PH5-45]MDH6387445.1 hypothetical protein [Dysgonomonas sp. PH5-37]
MKVFEALTFARPLVESILQAGANPKDVQYLEMYSEYLRLEGEGHKKVYIAAVLSDEYDITERTFYDIIKRLGRDLN